MVKSILIFFILVISSTISTKLYAQSVPPAEYRLVWSDEFDGKTLDMSKWNHHALGKRRLGYITEDSINVSNGSLKIIIHKKGNLFCSGMIDTRGKFETKYGYFEIRAKLPGIKGPQSAFWLLSQDYGKDIGNPEISGMEVDIMEYVKTSPGFVHFSTHWDGYKIFHKQNIASVLYTPIEDGQWHTFGLLWQPNSYKFYVDGKLMHSKNQVISNTAEYVLLSAEISTWGGGEQISEEMLPGRFEVDYIRVYQEY